MKTHPIRKVAIFKCGICHSTMHQEHDGGMLSCLRCDVIVKLSEEQLAALQFDAEVIPHRSPVIER